LYNGCIEKSFLQKATKKTKVQFPHPGTRSLFVPFVSFC
jgi:hypothetical protein